MLHTESLIVPGSTPQSSLVLHAARPSPPPSTQFPIPEDVHRSTGLIYTLSANGGVHDTRQQSPVNNSSSVLAIKDGHTIPSLESDNDMGGYTSSFPKSETGRDIDARGVLNIIPDASTARPVIHSVGPPPHVNEAHEATITPTLLPGMLRSIPLTLVAPPSEESLESEAVNTESPVSSGLDGRINHMPLSIDVPEEGIHFDHTLPSRDGPMTTSPTGMSRTHSPSEPANERNDVLSSYPVSGLEQDMKAQAALDISSNASSDLELDLSGDAPSYPLRMDRTASVHALPMAHLDHAHPAAAVHVEETVAAVHEYAENPDLEDVLYAPSSGEKGSVSLVDPVVADEDMDLGELLMGHADTNLGISALQAIAQELGTSRIRLPSKPSPEMDVALLLASPPLHNNRVHKTTTDALAVMPHSLEPPQLAGMAPEAVEGPPSVDAGNAFLVPLSSREDDLASSWPMVVDDDMDLDQFLSHHEGPALPGGMQEKDALHTRLRSELTAGMDNISSPHPTSGTDQPQGMHDVPSDYELEAMLSSNLPFYSSWVDKTGSVPAVSSGYLESVRPAPVAPAYHTFPEPLESMESVDALSAPSNGWKGGIFPAEPIVADDSMDLDQLQSNRDDSTIPSIQESAALLQENMSAEGMSSTFSSQKSIDIPQDTTGSRAMAGAGPLPIVPDAKTGNGLPETSRPYASHATHVTQGAGLRHLRRYRGDSADLNAKARHRDMPRRAGGTSNGSSNGSGESDDDGDDEDSEEDEELWRNSGGRLKGVEPDAYTVAQRAMSLDASDDGFNITVGLNAEADGIWSQEIAGGVHKPHRHDRNRIPAHEREPDDLKPLVDMDIDSLSPMLSAPPLPTYRASTVPESPAGPGPSNHSDRGSDTEKEEEALVSNSFLIRFPSLIYFHCTCRIN